MSDQATGELHDQAAAELSDQVTGGPRDQVTGELSDPAAGELRERVRSRYAQAARAVLEPGAGQAGCCEPSAGSCCALAPAALAAPSALAVGGFSEGLYRDGETDGLPEEAVLASLGCGNPLAVAELRDGERVLDLGSGGGIDVLLSARRVGPSGFAYGVDMTDDMLALARQIGRRVDRRGVLVHLLHQLRQPGRHHRPDPHPHLRRDRPGLGPGVHRCRDLRRRTRPSAGHSRTPGPAGSDTRTPASPAG